MLKLVVVVIFHLIVVFGNAASFFALLMFSPWYVMFPCVSSIIYLAFSRSARCPLTDLENKYRDQIGMPKIGGFIGHYLLRRRKK